MNELNETTDNQIEEKKESDLLSVIYLFGAGLVAYYLLDYFESSTLDSVRLPWFLAIAYGIGGKAVCAGLFWAIALLVFWVWTLKIKFGIIWGSGIVFGLLYLLFFTENYSYGAIIESIRFFTRT